MRVYPSVSFISSHKLFGVDETLIKPNSIAVSLKICHSAKKHNSQNALRMKLKKKGTPDLPMRTEVCFCVHKMRLYSYHILRKGGEFIKEVQKEGWSA